MIQTPTTSFNKMPFLKPTTLRRKGLVNAVIISAVMNFSLFSLCTQALPEDTQQEIRISSDKASLDRTKGEIIYSGNVSMQQGTLSIQADTVTLIRNAEGLQKVIAKGQPARYEQVLSVDEDKTHAYGETIIYRTDLEKLTLIDNAGLEKSGNLFTGEKIVYSIKDQRVQADGQSEDKSSGRIKMVIQPQDVKSEDEANPSNQQQ